MGVGGRKSQNNGLFTGALFLLLPSSRASRKIPRLHRLAHKTPVMQASVECASTARQKRELALYATRRHNRWRHCECQPVTSSIVASSQLHQGFQATPLPVGAKRKMFVRPSWKMLTVGYSSWVTKCLLLVNTSDPPHANTVQRRKETYILQIWWIELKYGFYVQNPAYFPRMYLWIFDKYSSTSFWQRLLTEIYGEMF